MRKPLLSGPRRGAGQRPRRCPWQPYVPSHWAPRYPPPQGLQRTLLVGLTVLNWLPEVGSGHLDVSQLDATPTYPPPPEL